MNLELHKSTCSRVNGSFELASYIVIKTGKCVECGAQLELPPKGWRKIIRDDIERGTIIRMTRLQDDGGYSMATIIGIYEHEENSYVEVARPYAYGRRDFNEERALLGAEVLPIAISKLLSKDSDVEVFQGRDDIRKMVT